MRELSETEKQVIIRLVKWEKILKEQPDNYFQLNLSILLGDLCKKYNSSFEIGFDKGEITLKSTNELKGTGLAENNSFRRDFISLIHFIDYLKNEKLIYIVPNDPDVNDISIERNCIIPNKRPFVSRINDNNFIKLLNELYFRDIYPTEYLTKYYDNDCKTDEEVRFNKSINIANEGVQKARTSINVAIGIGLATIILTLFTILKPNNDTQLILDRIDKLEEKTHNRFIELENRINIRLDSIDSRLKRVENELFVVKPWEKYYQEMTTKKTNK